MKSEIVTPTGVKVLGTRALVRGGFPLSRVGVRGVSRANSQSLAIRSQVERRNFVLVANNWKNQIHRHVRHLKSKNKKNVIGISTEQLCDDLCGNDVEGLQCKHER